MQPFKNVVKLLHNIFLLDAALLLCLRRIFPSGFRQFSTRTFSKRNSRGKRWTTAGFTVWTWREGRWSVHCVLLFESKHSSTLLLLFNLFGNAEKLPLRTSEGYNLGDFDPSSGHVSKYPDFLCFCF